MEEAEAKKDCEEELSPEDEAILKEPWVSSLAKRQGVSLKEAFMGVRDAGLI